MTVKEAWNHVKTEIKNVEIETANELEYSYVFSVRPSGVCAGVSTGLLVIVVDKDKGDIDITQIGDSKLTEGSYFKVLDPKTSV